VRGKETIKGEERRKRGCRGPVCEKRRGEENERERETRRSTIYTYRDCSLMALASLMTEINSSGEQARRSQGCCGDQG